jgi:hypothetical protein
LTWARTLAFVRVMFFIHDPEKRIVGWEADLGKRRRVPGALMGGYGQGLPHDLVQYVVEAATGYEHGFWGLVARGATFRSTGRRLTKPGRDVIARHREELRASERLAGAHVAQWQSGEQTPVTVALDGALSQWATVTPADMLTFEWPSTKGRIEPRTAIQR